MGFEEEEDEFEDDYEDIKAKRAKRISKKKKACGQTEFREPKLKAPPKSAPRTKIRSYNLGEFDDSYGEDDEYEHFYNGQWT
jgi:hypothetical protein